MTGGKPKRRRGAPIGNRNRLLHGRYAAAAIAQRKTRLAELREAALLDRLSAALVEAHAAGLLTETGVPPSGK